MSARQLLIFGRDGQVGSALMALLAPREDVTVTAVDIGDVDLADERATESLVLDTAPDWVINTSAHTAVDLAESEPELAHRINATAPGVIAAACRQCGAAMVHYSTDYVFDGGASRPYRETDEPNPQSVYGRTKLAGERAVARALDRFILLRTAWVYSPQGKNFVNTMLRLAGERDELSVVEDQFGSPTLAEDLAGVTLDIIDQVSSGKVEQPWGIYHATGQGVVNWSGFAEAIMSLSGNAGVRVKPIPGSDYPTPAPRPAYSVLSNERLARVFDLSLPPWRESLARCLESR
jgi:dTDP-4-dehydrorhamnose reductase